ncbi:SRPBCC family protein [Lutibacter sp.]|uniref:SRPBCC family protein n=1 Tax=Lutibacter sp. TaxID=1925666 RepID=UPI003563376B
MSYFQFKSEQKINATMNEVWQFIASPKNLKEITPPYMGFEVVTKDLSEKMYPGMIIGYKVSPLAGIKLNWLTEITHVVDGFYFVDEQRVGPYAIWHHQHKIEPFENGVLMTDIVTYKPPFGFIGTLLNSLIIKNKLAEIFDFRTKKIDQLFNH